MKLPVKPLLTLVLLVVAAAPALATNGMYLAGYGTEAGGRGGANIAVADRSLGMQANPAGISQLVGNHFSVDIQFLMPDLDYSDPQPPMGLGNSIEGENQVFPMPSISYARGGSETKWTWGIALVSQGGMGAHFKGYNTPFGSVDETFSEVRFARLIPTVSYAFNKSVSLGLSVNLGYSDVAFRFWPETSFYTDAGTPMDPSDDVGFFGMDMTDAPGTFNYSFRLGLMWRINSIWQLGAIYETETESDYDGGKLVLDQTALGLGRVTYDAAVDGFTWPEQYGIGIQVRPGETWMIAADLKRYNWNSAVSLINVQATNPDNPMTPITEQQIPFVFNWDDQTVFALGAEWRTTDAIALRAGYNHGDSPVPDETLNPLFPATPEDHATLGLGYTWKGNTFNFAIERAFENSQTNPTMNPMINPFGPGATVDHAQWTVSFGYSLAFSRKSAR